MPTMQDVVQSLLSRGQISLRYRPSKMDKPFILLFRDKQFHGRGFWAGANFPGAVFDPDPWWYALLCYCLDLRDVTELLNRGLSIMRCLFTIRWHNVCLLIGNHVNRGHLVASCNLYLFRAHCHGFGWGGSCLFLAQGFGGFALTFAGNKLPF